MANIFVNNKNTESAPVTERSILAAKYNRGVANLLLVILFTVINVVLLVTNSNSYFLFSAFVPYLLADYGMYFTGLYPEEYYYDAGSAVFFDKSFLTVMLVIAGLILVLYLLSWLFARKQKIGWLIFATVLFAIDTAAMLILLGISSDMILDLVFHGWVIVSLIMSISAYFKMKKLPEEEVVVRAEAIQEDSAEPEPAVTSEAQTEE